MTLPPDTSLELLDRYFSGRCTPEEARQVRVAIASDTALAAFQRVVDGEPVDIDVAWRRFQQSSWMQRDLRAEGHSVKRVVLWRSARVGAIVAGVLGVFAVLRNTPGGSWLAP